MLSPFQQQFEALANFIGPNWPRQSQKDYHSLIEEVLYILKVSFLEFRRNVPCFEFWNKIIYYNLILFTVLF